MIAKIWWLASRCLRHCKASHCIVRSSDRAVLDIRYRPGGPSLAMLHGILHDTYAELSK